MTSATDTLTFLPPSLESVPLGGTYYLEVWTTDRGIVNSGLTSAYIDVIVPAPVTTVLDVTNATLFSYFDSGEDLGDGTVDELGGSNLPGGVGIEPEWVRVGIVELQASGTAPVASLALAPSSTSTAALARDAIPWEAVSLEGVTLRQGTAGDIDGDGDVDGDDMDLFVAVLLGTENDPAYIIACDFTGDGAANGADINGFVACLLNGGCP